MKDIKCPSCGKTFRIDPSSFEEILLQIKDEELNKQIKERLILAEEDSKKRSNSLTEAEDEFVDDSGYPVSSHKTLDRSISSADIELANKINILKESGLI